MSSEFPAQRAREITCNYAELSSEIWYRKYKDSLFQQINDSALNGNNQIIISHGEWTTNDIKKEYLILKLNDLGYSVKVINSIMTISW
jgi:hypothetical protein